jgi:hypothetical protein
MPQFSKTGRYRRVVLSCQWRGRSRPQSFLVRNLGAIVMDSAILFFSLWLSLLAGNDLLDHLPTEAYWKAKGVAVSGEAMLAQLQDESEAIDTRRFIRELGAAEFETREKATQALINAGSAVANEVRQAMLSEDPEVSTRAKRIARLLQQAAGEAQVRRLMAVRALGELRFAPAEAVLKKFAIEQPGQTMLAHYAQRALQQIQQPGPDRQTVQRQLPSPEQRLSDVALLPASSVGVLQIALHERLKMPLEPGIDFKPFFGRGIPADTRAPTYLAKLIALADTVGNVRLDSLSASLASSNGGNQWFAAGVVRGEWNLANVRSLLAGAGFRLSVEQGLEVASHESSCRVLLLSDRRLYLAWGEGLDELPIKSLTSGGDASGLLRQNKRLWQLLEKTDRAQPLWGTMISSPASDALPWLAPMESLTLGSDLRGEKLKLTVQARASDSKQVDVALVEFEKMLDKAEPESGQIAAMFLCAKPLAELMESLRTERKPGGVTATAETPGVAPLLALPLVLTHNDWLK